MPYLSLNDFRFGMDRRRKRVAGVPGALWTLKNAHITRGGDIERAKKFVSAYSLPAGSQSLAGVRSQLYTFGSADLAATTPVGVQYQRLLPHASSLLSIASGQNAVDAETLVIDAKTYTFEATLTNVDGHIHIGATRLETLTNLANAINASGGVPGTDYATANTIHPTVRAVDNGDGTMTAYAKTAGAGGDSIVVTEAMTQGAWNPNATMAGGAAAMTKVLDAEPFQGSLYVIAKYDDGNIYHFFNSTRVSDWDNFVASTAGSVAERLSVELAADDDVDVTLAGTILTLTARAAGTAFTIAVADADGGADATQSIAVANLQANVAAVAEVRATADIEVTGGTNDPGTNTINSVTINSVEVLADVVDWSGSNEATAIRVAAQINNGSATHGYTAAVVGATITVTAAVGTGTTPNGYAVAVTTTGDVTDTSDATMAGGVAAVAAVAQIEKITVSGTIENRDSFTVTVNGTDYITTGLASGMGTSLYVDKQRVWSPAGSVWNYCSLGDATEWDPAAAGDAGNIDVAEETEGTDVVSAAARYQSFAAVFAQSFIVLYTLDTDPANNAVADQLDNTGTNIPGSIVRYGNNDVFYLDTTGIRSLRARDASNAPFVSDVGNSVDSFVQETLASLTQQQVLDAVGAIEPRDGRFWLASGGYIFVLSYFPSDKITAWSYYQPDEFGGDTVSDLVRAGKRLYVRAGDEVYLYGGAEFDQEVVEDESEVTVELPFLDANKPATFKEFTGFDLAATNEWEVSVVYDPNDESKIITVGRITEITFNEMATALVGGSSKMAFKLTCRRAGAATISSMQIHYATIPGVREQ